MKKNEKNTKKAEEIQLFFEKKNDFFQSFL